MRSAQIELQNACVIVAMQQLLGDPEWSPSEVLRLILQHDGYPSAHNRDLASHAPVEVFTDCKVAFGDGSLLMVDGARSVSVGPQERVVLLQRTSPGRGHAECMTVPEVVALLTDIASGKRPNEILCVVVRKEVR